VESTNGLQLHATTHANQQIAAKGLSAEAVEAVFRNPEKVYPNNKYKGQYRVTGAGLCLVGVPNGSTFSLITVYEDGKMTPPRPEQLSTPEGRAYAKRYALGQNRQNEYRPRVNARRKGSQS